MHKENGLCRQQKDPGNVKGQGMFGNWYDWGIYTCSNPKGSAQRSQRITWITVSDRDEGKQRKQELSHP
jgi:hypothetical protein